MEQKEWNPGTLLAVSGAYWQTCALHAGVKLDLFSAIGDRSPVAEELAGERGTDPRALGLLLNALAAMGILKREGESYSNTPASRRFLCTDADSYIGYMILHHYHLFDSWGQLEQGIRTGRAVAESSSFSDSEQRESFLMGMFNNAMLQAPLVAEHIDLSGCRRLLDLGGGPGTYAIHFCREHPELRAAIFDLPTSQPFAEKTIERFGMGGRIEFIGGNYLEDRIGGVFDVAWLSHILHGEGPEACRLIVRKAADALETGGLILIHEFILDETRDAPLFPALFSLNMLLRTDSGRSYTETELGSMLEDAGITKIQRLAFKGPTESGILLGIKNA